MPDETPNNDQLLLNDPDVSSAPSSVAEPPPVTQETEGQWNDDFSVFTSADGFQYDPEGKPLEVEASTPAPTEVTAAETGAPTAAEPPRYQPAFPSPLDNAEAELEAALGSLDPAQMKAGVAEYVRKQLDHAGRQFMAIQAVSQADPIHAAAQQITYALASSNPQMLQHPDSRNYIEQQAYLQVYGPTEGVIGATRRWLDAKQANQAQPAPKAPERPRDAQTGQFVPKQVRPAAPAPSGRPQPQGAPISRNVEDRHVKDLMDRFGISEYEARQAARETTRR